MSMRRTFMQVGAVLLSLTLLALMTSALKLTVRMTKIITEQDLPAVYGLFLVTLLLDHGHDEADILLGCGLTRAQLQDHSRRISGTQYVTLLANALRLSGPSVSYELGLRSQLTLHGFVGFGLASCANMGDAIVLGQRYMQARVPLFSSRLHQEGDQVVIDLIETVPLGPLYEFIFNQVLVELCCLFSRLIAVHKEPSSWRAEIWVPYAEPAYHAQWRDRLPPFRFNQACPQIRFPAFLLEQTIATANPTSAQLAIDQCERELARLKQGSSLRSKVTRQLVCRDGRYPDLGTVASQLCLTERTLKRHLQVENLGFQQLLDEVREADSRRLLAHLGLSIEQIAQAVGFKDPANFTRAFRKWTGIAPREYRQSLQASDENGPI